VVLGNKTLNVTLSCSIWFWAIKDVWFESSQDECISSFNLTITLRMTNRNEIHIDALDITILKEFSSRKLNPIICDCVWQC
jgi:hypothetical protein